MARTKKTKREDVAGQLRERTKQLVEDLGVEAVLVIAFVEDGDRVRMIDSGHGVLPAPIPDLYRGAAASHERLDRSDTEYVQ